MIFMKVDNYFMLMLVFNFAKERFLNLTINMQLLYFITTVTSQSSFSQAPSACGVQCSTERLVCPVTGCYNLPLYIPGTYLRGGGGAKGGTLCAFTPP